MAVGSSNAFGEHWLISPEIVEGRQAHALANMGGGRRNRIARERATPPRGGLSAKRLAVARVVVKK